METIKIKHRIFEKNADISENSFIASHKGKKYQILKFEPKTESGMELAYSVKRISSANISAPKLYLLDKKEGYVVRELLEGETVMRYISRQDLPEKIYEQLFNNQYIAKTNRMTINYDIDKWIIKNDTLFYMYPHFIEYNEEKDLIKRYIRLWFKTKELVQFLGKNGLSFDKNRLSDEYATNKEIVLMTCKYYK